MTEKLSGEWTVIVRYGEVAVKGEATRSRMEGLLVKALKEALTAEGVIYGGVERLRGRIIIRGFDSEETAKRASWASARVFGVKSASPAFEVEFRGLEDLVVVASSFFAPRVKGRSFMVRARRSGVEPFTSKDVERELGRALLESGAPRVDLKSPDYVAFVEVRGRRAYLYDTIVEGPGGLPVGSEEPALVLFSGGFDSTVAAWRMMRRGVPVHLVFYDLGFPEVLEVAVEAAKYLADNWAYGHRPKLYIVNFRGAALVVNGLVAPSYRTLVLRRLMLLHAEDLALKEGYEALVTGESVGQVASQTVRNLRLIGGGLRLPVIRPLAGHDKDEIVAEARRIGVYEIVARQREVCGVDTPPTPRASEKAFNSELEKVKDVFIPDPIIVDLRSSGLEEIKGKLRLKM
ncbi:MAG: tRNA sulfurtransferase [Desulfurococcales archaeon]|nr:tRNA sulfurtransferase [Desulfurococcales archaeon]